MCVWGAREREREMETEPDTKRKRREILRNSDKIMYNSLVCYLFIIYLNAFNSGDNLMGTGKSPLTTK